MEPKRRLIQWLGVGAFVSVVALEVAAVAIWARHDFAPPGYVFMRGAMPLLSLLVSLFAQACSGLILMLRRPANRVGWTIMAFATATAIAPVVVAATADSRRGVDPGVGWLAWATSALIFPTASFLAFLLAFLFPDGRLLSKRWRTAVALVGVIAASAALAVASRPGPLLLFPAAANPSIALPPGFEWVSALALGLLAASGGLVGIALVGRYRVSDPETRTQIRWYVTGGVLLAGTYTAHVATVLSLPPLDPLGEFVEILNFVVLGIPPIAITIAILRYRLYEIDTIISRAFVYGTLTAVLAGLYAASIRFFNDLFGALIGQNSDLALVITTLILATTFTPIKGRLERIVDRRLHPGHEPARASQPLTAADLLDDPAFASAIDARIRVLLAERPLEAVATVSAPDDPAATDDRLTAERS